MLLPVEDIRGITQQELAQVPLLARDQCDLAERWRSAVTRIIRRIRRELRLSFPEGSLQETHLRLATEAIHEEIARAIELSSASGAPDPLLDEELEELREEIYTQSDELLTPMPVHESKDKSRPKKVRAKAKFRLR